MKKEIIRSKLTKYHHKGSNTILLEVLRGTPRSSEGGEWIEIGVDDLEAITEDVNFNPVSTGYSKYLEKWYTEGLITAKERNAGRDSTKDKTG